VHRALQLAALRAAESARSPVQAASPLLIGSLAARLLRSVFAWYFLVTIIVTCGQLTADYLQAERRLVDDIAAMERTFTPGITDAMWNLSDDVLRGILSGMRELPAVVGVKVVDEQGKLIQGMGMVRDAAGVALIAGPQGFLRPESESTGFLGKLLSREFAIVHTGGNGERRTIGTWTVYTDRRIIVGQVGEEFCVVLINSVIKTLALWLILFVVIGRMVGRPLRQLSAFVAGLNIDNLGSETFVLEQQGRNELHLLAQALNIMIAKLRGSVQENSRLVDDLREMNATLQARVAAQVAQRTQDLETLACTDTLTGLGNRRLLDSAVSDAADRARSSGGILSVIICDVDHFKQVNDVHGHQAGDAVLADMSALLTAGVRSSDVVGRWGGEEFMIVCPQAPLAPAARLAERLRRKVEAHRFAVVGSKTCSFGVAELRPDETTTALIGRADAALYRAKQGGRNRVEADGEEVKLAS
jgi:diguanylate cyclase (GGDEF)-like protein